MNREQLTLTREEMKDFGYKVVDLIVDHFDTLPDQKPVSRATRPEMDQLLMEHIPMEGSAPEEVLAEVRRKVLPYTDLLTHPQFYAFAPSPNNFISTMADSIATAYNIFSGGWISSPGGAEVEIVTINWLLEMIGFPVKEGGGIFTSGGSMANLTGLTAARKIKCGDDFSKGTIYLSAQTHSSNFRAAKIIGFRDDQLRVIPVDSDFRIDLEALKSQIESDKKSGKKPFCILANAGTTNTGSVDPLVEIAAICKEEGLWMHVDGAYGGAAAITDHGREVLKGLELADSVTIDPHKWLFQPYEIGCLLVKDHRYLSGTFSDNPEYLRDIKGNADEINFYELGVQLTRRCRALKLYMSMKIFGVQAFKKAVAHGIEMAERLEEYLRKDPNWEILSPATLAVVTFRYKPVDVAMNKVELDNLNQYISNSIIRSQQAMIATTLIRNNVSLRMCTVNPRGTFEQMKMTVDHLTGYAMHYLRDYPE